VFRVEEGGETRLQGVTTPKTIIDSNFLKMVVFWVVAPCRLVEVYNVSEVLAASIIRAMS
jgi:hypothetical protein